MNAWPTLPHAVWHTVAALAAAACLAPATAHAQDKTITLCRAAWDPANALVELSKDFTAKTQVKMKFEFVPWPNFADRMLNELNSKGKLCDLIIGDSQWIGGSAENGHYVKLNEFFDKNGIKMSDFLPATVYAYSTWPKGSPNYHALPAMGDALGWTYRRDWFAKPELQAEFKNYSGDMMNFAMAAEMVDRDNATVIVNDDVAVEHSTYTTGRRGVAGTLLVEKIVGAAAERGDRLAALEALGDSFSQATASMGVALTSCTVPAAGKPTFQIGIDEMEMGVGIHGELGRRRVCG